MRRLAGRLLLGLFSVALFAGAGKPAAEPKGLEIYFIDVMGGAATLVVTPERETILLDSGWPGLNDRDPKRIEHVLKNVAKLEQIDYLVTTHWHTDHYGGVEGLSKRVKIAHFLDRGLPDLSKPDEDKANFPDGPRSKDPLGIAYRKASEGKRSTLKAGDRLPLKGSIEAVVLAASGQVDPTSEGAKNPNCESAPADQEVDPSDNAKSISIRFKLGEFGFLDCGDLTWNIERQLVCPINKIGQIDLFQVTHHGAESSNHPTLVRSIEPVVAVMNNGPRKGGSPRTVETLKSIPTLRGVYALHRNVATKPDQNVSPGDIANKSTDGGEFVRVVVAPDGKTFRVQFGADGEAKTFESR